MAMVVSSPAGVPSHPIFFTACWVISSGFFPVVFEVIRMAVIFKIRGFAPRDFKVASLFGSMSAAICAAASISALCTDLVFSFCVATSIVGITESGFFSVVFFPHAVIRQVSIKKSRRSMDDSILFLAFGKEKARGLRRIAKSKYVDALKFSIEQLYKIWYINFHCRPIA